MAAPGAEQQSEQVLQEVKAGVEKRKETLVQGKYTFDLLRADELTQSFNDMTDVLRATQTAVNQITLKKPKDQEQAREVFKREITEALTVLRDAMGNCQTYSRDLIDRTRHELVQLGELTKEAPPRRLFGYFAEDPDKIQEWLDKANRDPVAALKDAVGGACEIRDRAATEVPTEAAQREGLKEGQKGMHLLARYASGSITEERLKGLDLEH